MASTAGCCAVIFCLFHSALSQDVAGLTFSSNPVYIDMPLKLTCSYWPGVLLFAKVDAFNGTSNLGYLSCGVQESTTTDVGVFRNSSFTGCPTLPARATNVSVTLTARSSLELDYNCSATVVAASTVSTVTSGRVSLQVYVCPLPLTFLPSLLVFNDSDNATVSCESRNGKPTASVSLTVANSTGSTLATASGTNSASWVPLSSLADWHNATVTCRVINHNCPNSSITSSVLVNHIKSISVPDLIYRNESVLLNCSTYIRYYPGVQFSWTIPPAADVHGSLNLEWITVPHGQIGLFYCTATNNVTLASVVIVFTVSNSSRPSTTANQGSSGCELCLIIGLVLGIIAFVIIAVFIGILCKRGHFSKGRTSPLGYPMHHPGVVESSNATTHHSVDREYDSLDIQWSGEPTYTQLALEQNITSTTLYENFKSSERQFQHS